MKPAKYDNVICTTKDWSGFRAGWMINEPPGWIVRRIEKPCPKCGSAVQVIPATWPKAATR